MRRYVCLQISPCSAERSGLQFDAGARRDSSPLRRNRRGACIEIHSPDPLMPETIPADIAAAIDIFHLRALREGRLGIGTVSSSEAANAASEARKRLEAAITMHLHRHDGRDVIVPWSFGGKDCLHPRGFEAECECVGCPRKAGR